MLEFVSVLLIAVAASYIVIVPTIIVMILFLFMRAYYIKTARDIKRLEAIGMFVNKIMYVCILFQFTCNIRFLLQHVRIYYIIS